MTLQEQLEVAKTEVQAAASKGYEVYTNARRKVQDLEEQIAAEEMGDTANDTVCIQGKTYENRKELKSLGLRWESGIQAWIGLRKDVHGQLPEGCHMVTYATAALDSMDHQDSII